MLKDRVYKFMAIFGKKLKHHEDLRDPWFFELYLTVKKLILLLQIAYIFQQVFI